MKYVLMLDTPIWMITSGILGVWGYSWKKRVKALKEPQLLLPRRERKAWARKELKERDEDRQREQYERDLGIAHGSVFTNPIKEENI